MTAEGAALVRGLRILVAEDNLTNQKLVARMLEKNGHSVVLAGDGFQALDEVRRSAFDLVLMDIQMPGMDGCEASREIRRREAAGGERLPIIAVTAHAMNSDRDRCLDAGMDEFVSKPIRFAELNEKIQAVVALCHH
jgi:CheY-like chemotaxis protein